MCALQVGEFYEAMGTDAVVLVQWAGLNPMGSTHMPPRAGCPHTNIRRTLQSLVEEANLSVVHSPDAGFSATHGICRQQAFLWWLLWCWMRSLHSSPAGVNHQYHIASAAQPVQREAEAARDVCRWCARKCPRRKHTGSGRRERCASYREW